MPPLFLNLSRSRAAQCLLAGVALLVARVALLPVWPIPLPGVYDEFSYLLAADTFAHGRLTNPAHALPEFFETIEVLQKPTYASRYPPGQGLILAAGQVLFGHPWFGVWLSCGLLAASLLWAFYGWLPRRWAPVALLPALHLCFAGYWMNSYWGGAVAAIGGALVVGAVGRLRARLEGPRWLLCALAAGVVILAISRPFEGLLLALACGFVALRRVPRLTEWLAPALILVTGLGWLGVYNHAVTGSALRMPYQAYFEQYETIPPFSFVPAAEASTRNYGHFNFEMLDVTLARRDWEAARQPAFLLKRTKDWIGMIRKITGTPFWMIPLAGCLPWLWKNRRTRFLTGLFGLIFATSFVVPPFFVHYLAPFIAVIFILLAQATRRLGAAGTVMLVALIGHTWTVFALQVVRGNTPDTLRPANAYRGRVESSLAENEGGHVILVHYTRLKVPHGEWIYNTADIDRQHVIWAQDMGPEKDGALVAYYPKRKFWYFEPDEPGAKPVPLELHPGQ